MDNLPKSLKNTRQKLPQSSFNSMNNRNMTRKRNSKRKKQPILPNEMAQIPNVNIVQENKQNVDGGMEIEINGTKCIIYPDIKVFEHKPLKYESPEFNLKLINDLYASTYDKLYNNDQKKKE